MRLIIRTESKFILLERKRIMKNLKKALALFVAAASVFGTVASAADMTVFNSVTDSNYNMAYLQGKVDGVEGNNFSYQRGGLKKAAGHDMTFGEDGSMTLTATAKDNFASSQMGSAGLSGHVDGETALARQGNIEASITFKLNPWKLNDDWGGQALGCSPYIYPLTIGYVPAGATDVTYTNMGIVAKDELIYSSDQWGFGAKLVMAGKKSEGFNVVRRTYTYTLTAKINTVEDYASLILTYVDSSTGETTTAQSLEITPEDGIDLVFAKVGYNIRIPQILSATFLDATAKYQTYYATNPSVTVDGSNVTGTAVVAKNERTNTERKAVMIMAQYDASGNFLKADVSNSVTLTTERPMTFTDKTQEQFNSTKTPAGQTLTVTTTKADDYDHAKMFVWDSVAGMAPVSVPLTAE